MSAERKAFPKLENVLSLQQGNSSLRLPVVLIPVQELSPNPDGMGETESGVLSEGERDPACCHGGCHGQENRGLCLRFSY